MNLITIKIENGREITIDAKDKSKYKIDSPKKEAVKKEKKGKK